MKLSDIKGEDALEVVADLLDPIAKISQNNDFKKIDRKNRLVFFQTVLRSCKKEIIEILAILDRTPVDEYEVSLATLPGKVAELFSDPSVQMLFGLQGWDIPTSSGSATESIEVVEK